MHQLLRNPKQLLIFSKVFDIRLEQGETMKIVEFYRNERGNINGHRLDDVMGFSLGAMEMDHDYIQFILPSNETSSMNGDAPTLTREEATILSEDPELREKVKASFLKFIDFLGL